MGTGFHGGFGKTEGAKDQDLENQSWPSCDNRIISETEDHLMERQSLPPNDDQLKHIFSERAGHLKDTPENRRLLTDLANDKSKFVGIDRYGNSWNIETNSDGSQNWVRYQNGIINEGGQNTTPRPWNNETGLYNNPVKRRKKGK